METAQSTPTYRVWGADNVAYGPVELPTLIDWVKDDRITPETWVYADAGGGWRPAVQLSELKLFFDRQVRAADGVSAADASRGPALRPGVLRRLKVLAGLDEKQLESFVHYMEVIQVRQFSHVVRKGDHGDAMYLVLEGEVRALTMVDQKETTLATMATGDFFGEISLLDQGPRSADIVANKESVLLKVSSSAFDRLVREAPALALPFLLAISKSVVGRIRTLTKRYEDSIHFARAATGRR